MKKFAIIITSICILLIPILISFITGFTPNTINAEIRTNDNQVDKSQKTIKVENRTNDNQVDKSQKPIMVENRTADNQVGEPQKTIEPIPLQNSNKPAIDKKAFMQQLNIKANAASPLKIKTYDGFNQPMHPDVVYIDSGFHGYKYWMAYTPYPYEVDQYENPCIAVSNDGISWTVPKGLKNPLVQPPDDSKEGGHYSDTDIVFNNDKLEVYFVYNKRGIMGPSKFYRVTSSDGANWSKPELIYQCAKPLSGYSPAFMKSSDGYIMWYISEGNMMFFSTSSDGKSWSQPLRCNIKIDNWTVWHLDIMKTEMGYEGLLCAKDINIGNRALYYITSSDGVNWICSPKPVIYPSENGWDSSQIYRSTMIKQNGLYRVWYSAEDLSKKWHIGYTEGKNMDSLEGVKEILQASK